MYIEMLKAILKNLFFGLIFALLFLFIIRALKILSYSELLAILIFSFLCIIGMFFYIHKKEKELYNLYSDKKEQYDSLYKKYKELQENKLQEEIKQISDHKNIQQNAITIEENQNIRKCDICGSSDRVEYFPTDGYIEKNGNKTFLSGGVKLCRKCLESCKTCKICNKLIPTKEIEKYINDLMKHPKFCSHIFAHKKIAEIKEKYNIDNQ